MRRDEPRGPTSPGAEPIGRGSRDARGTERVFDRTRDGRSAPTPLDLPDRSVTVWLAALMLAIVACMLGACSSEPPVDETALVIEPGVGMGPVRLGMRYDEAASVLGQAEGAFVVSRIAFARYPDRELELVLTSPEETALTPDSIVVGIGVAEGASVRGPVVPGATRADVERALGEADVVESLAFYPSGLSVEYDGDRAIRVGVIAPYERRPDAPEMTEASR